MPVCIFHGKNYHHLWFFFFSFPPSQNEIAKHAEKNPCSIGLIYKRWQVVLSACSRNAAHGWCSRPTWAIYPSQPLSTHSIKSSCDVRQLTDTPSLHLLIVALRCREANGQLIFFNLCFTFCPGFFIFFPFFLAMGAEPGSRSTLISRQCWVEYIFN